MYEPKKLKAGEISVESWVSIETIPQDELTAILKKEAEAAPGAQKNNEAKSAAPQINSEAKDAKVDQVRANEEALSEQLDNEDAGKQEFQQTIEQDNASMEAAKELTKWQDEAALKRNGESGQTGNQADLIDEKDEQE